MLFTFIRNINNWVPDCAISNCFVNVHWLFVLKRTHSFKGISIQRMSLHKKTKFSSKDFFSKCDQISRKLRIWSHLLKKSLMEKLQFLCSVWVARLTQFAGDCVFFFQSSFEANEMLCLLNKFVLLTNQKQPLKYVR